MVNIYKLKLTSLQQEILRLLFVTVGKSLNQRRISEFLEVSQPAVMKALPELEKEGLVKVEQDMESKRWSVELNRENYKTIQLKRVDNLRILYESGFVDVVEQEFAGATVILFGSYSWGEDTVRSDIDIAVVGRKEKDIDIEKFEKILGREININFYDSFKEIHKNLRENILNGITLIGEIDL